MSGLFSVFSGFPLHQNHEVPPPNNGSDRPDNNQQRRGGLFGAANVRNQQDPPGFMNFLAGFDGLPGFMDYFGGHDADMAAAMRASMQEVDHGPPPCSTLFLKQLPLISVTRQDLVEPANRECSICLEPNVLKSKILRLPCAHIFCPDCAFAWLKKHNTCPVCRYELPTDNPSYEIDRIQRMRTRRPRFARFELERLTIRELKELLQSRNGDYHPVDKPDLIQYLISSNRIELIHAPPPVDYGMHVLQAMSIRQLKQAMEDAGVFYTNDEVVEKDDLLQIFLRSGRLNIVVNSDGQKVEEDVSKMPATSSRGENLCPSVQQYEPNHGFVETVMSDEEESDQKIDRRSNQDVLLEEDEEYASKEVRWVFYGLT
jgi:hypothetical protein